MSTYDPLTDEAPHSPHRSEIPADAPLYRPLLYKDRLRHDPLDVTRDFIAGVEALPETTSTFRKRHVLRDSEYTAESISNTMIRLSGAWEMPDWYTGSIGRTGANLYVNPNAPDAWIYSPVYATCECGALVTSIDKTGVNDRDTIPGERDHTDDCCQIWRWDARHELSHARRESVILSLRHGHNTMHCGHRSGYTTKSLGGNACPRHNIDAETESDWYRTAVANTTILNLHRHSALEIAEVFGIADSTLYRWIDRYGAVDVNGNEMQAARAGGD